MHEITLQAMRFHALVGILPHERTVAQPIEIDLRVRVADGDIVVDYRALYDIVSAVISAGPLDFLEQIADRIAVGAIEHNARVRMARVAVRKPHVALAGPLAYAEVVVERSAE
jgi:7,8-dihydroneopterin aldolase/epimerase/oxygenase